MFETLAYGYSSESTQRKLSNEYQYDRVKSFKKSLCPGSLDKSSLSIGRVKPNKTFQSFLCGLMWIEAKYREAQVSFS